MPVHDCPYCRCDHDEDAERVAQIAARVAEWKATCADKHLRIRGDYVTESVAAQLIGVRPSVLRKHRHDGNGPPYLNLDGCPFSYRLTELAAWEAAHQEGESWKS